MDKSCVNMASSGRGMFKVIVARMFAASQRMLTVNPRSFSLERMADMVTLSITLSAVTVRPSSAKSMRCGIRPMLSYR